MKRRLEVIIERLIKLQDDATDDEFSDELANALIHLDAAHDRLVAIEEEEEEEEDV
jgi:Holliday junction resolvasome RuvABC endonuclease subunit